MTQEEKARAYDEALARARDYHKRLLDDDNPEWASEIERMFPELKDSEDEKIRKWIINEIKINHHNLDEDCVDFVDKAIAWLEKQGEQKPANNVELKFEIEEGKWYICISQFCNCIEGRVYKATSDSRIIDDFGTEYDMHSDAYKYFRLWTIQDAKDGDVLACNEEILLFKSYSVQNRISLYCWYNGQTNNFHSKEVVDTSLTTRNKICPATKEQHDTLMKAMADAGYTFDFEKKELKKIEQNPWSEEDEEILYSIINDIEIRSGRITLAELKESYTKQINWLKSLKDRVQPQPMQEWSKEAENNILFLTSIIEECFKDKEKITLCGDTVCANFTKENVIDRLKSLIPQSTWKPSDEEMEAL